MSHSIFQPTYTRDGKRRKSKVWWVKAYVPGAGAPIRRSLKTRDKRAARRLAAEVARRAEHEALGIDDALARHRTAPIAAHLEDFALTFVAKGTTPKHKVDRLGCLSEFIDFAGVRTVSDLAPVEADRWIAALLSRGLAARTINRRIQALRQFGRWLHRCRRQDHDPFAGIALRKEQTDRRVRRRAFSPDEMARLLEAAAARPLRTAERSACRRGVPEARRGRLEAVGDSRAFLYRFAALSGLRNGELRRLRFRDVTTSAAGWIVTVPAASAKSRRDQVVPLHRSLADDLRRHKTRLHVLDLESHREDLVFPGKVFPQPATFARDLREAGIRKVDSDGRSLSFHSLRHTFVSSLTAAGVHPRTVQALARHSRIHLTTNTYTDTSRIDLRGALDHLPGLDVALPVTLPAEGPDSAPSCATPHDRATRPDGRDGRRSPWNKALEPLLCGAKDGGSDGTRTRDLRLDRPVGVRRKSSKRRKLGLRHCVSMS